MTHIATLIAPPETPLSTAAVARASAALPGRGAPDWLAPGIAVDLPFAPGPGGGVSPCVDRLREALEGAPVDVVAQPIGFRRKSLLVADMDSTLIQQECIDELADAMGLRARVSAITERSMRGEVSFEASLLERVALLRGLDVGTATRIVVERITEMPGARALARTMRAHGALTVIASGGFTLFTAHVARALGMDRHYSNALVVENGRLAGTLHPPIFGRASKRATLRALRDELGLAPEQTLAVGGRRQRCRHAGGGRPRRGLSRQAGGGGGRPRAHRPWRPDRAVVPARLSRRRDPGVRDSLSKDPLVKDPRAGRNSITDVAGLLVGCAEDARIASGVTVVLFDEPCVASISVGGGAPGLRDTALLKPGMSVERVDALVLSGGSAFGLDAMGGVQAHLRELGRGFRVRDVTVPIVPGAILFDLANGGDKAWSGPVYWHLGLAAARAVSRDVAVGTAGAGFGATTADLKGGQGTASAVTSGGFTVGALVAVNALGRATIGEGPWFWAAPYERDGEFGGRGWPCPIPGEALACVIKGTAPENTTIAIVAADAALSKAEAKRLATMAQDGLAKALRPTHAALDGDTVFAAATARAPRAPNAFDLVEIGTIAADCLARAIARAVHDATALPFPGALPSWRDRFGWEIRRA